MKTKLFLTIIVAVLTASPSFAKWKANLNTVGLGDDAEAVSLFVPSSRNPTVKSRILVICEGSYSFISVEFDSRFSNHYPPVGAPASVKFIWDGQSASEHSARAVPEPTNLIFDLSETDKVVALLKKSSVVAFQTDLFGGDDSFEWNLSGSSAAINKAFAYC